MWEMKTAMRREKWTLYLRSCICVPSPQSIINCFPLTSTTCDEQKCLPVGSALPHPKIFT